MKRQGRLLSLYIFMAMLFLALRPGGYQVGDEARDFSLKNVDGKIVSLSQYKSAKGFIVIFTCNTCPYSKLYEDRIIELHNRYADQGYPVIAINPNDPQRQPGDSFSEMVQRSKQKSFPFPYVLDETQQIAESYGATRTPHVFVLKKEGEKNIIKYIGAIDNNSADPEMADVKYVESAVDQLIQNKRVTTTFTKAIGCTIKWRES